MGILSYGYKAGKKVFDTITKVKPNVPKTKLEKATSKLNIAKHKTKMSKAKLNKTLFDIDQASKKTMSNSELKDQADYLNKTGKYKVKKRDGGRIGLKKGGGKFPDHSGDGKITQKDILMAKGVIPKTKSKKKVI